jgi:hypothetical protein
MANEVSPLDHKWYALGFDDCRFNITFVQTVVSGPRDTGSRVITFTLIVSETVQIKFVMLTQYVPVDETLVVCDVAEVDH